MKNLLFYFLILLLSGCSAIFGHEYFIREHSLRKNSEKPIGVAVDVDALRNNKIYKKILLREFDSITPENAMKMEHVLLQDRTYNFADTDYLVNFAIENKLRFRGHNLIWYRQVPKWLADKEIEEIDDIFENHIKTLVQRYHGKVYVWDVVNEAFLRNGSYRNSIWNVALGPVHIERAFRLARVYDNNAKLFYNDYGLEQFGPKFDAVYSMLKDFLSRGVPIDGIGLQAHLKTNSKIDELRQVIKKFSDLGLIVEITELDVALSEKANKSDKRRQEEIFGEVVSACSELKECTGLTFWGLSDSHSWITTGFPGYGRATLFNKNYKSKSTYRAVLNNID